MSLSSNFRHSAGGRYAIAAGCPEAATIASQVLDEGGNVVDAAVAAASACCVAMPHMTGVGGDLFALVGLRGQPVVALNASGAAPAAASPEAYRARGLDMVPMYGGLAVQSPGLPAGLEALASRFGSRPLGQMLQPAIRLAQEGVPVSQRLARSIAEQSRAFADYPTWNRIYRPDGKALVPGDTLMQNGLARTLQTWADMGAAAMFQGWVGRDIAQAVQTCGGLLTTEDLQEACAEWCEPLQIQLGDVEVFSQPPVAAGFILLRALSLAATRPGTSHAVAALQQAFAERLALLGDGEPARQIARDLLAMPTDASMAARPLRRSASHTGGDTTALALMDSDGNAVSLILSIYANFGSGVVAPECGVLLNNRLSSFFLDEGHANVLPPRRRAMHTLHTFMVRDDLGVRWAGGSPGADNQPQANFHVLKHLLQHQDQPGEAVSRPRWALAPGTDPHALRGSPRTVIQHEPDLDPQLGTELRQCPGWEVQQLPTPSIGSSKLVGRMPDGRVGAWTDCRRHGFVAAN